MKQATGELNMTVVVVTLVAVLVAFFYAVLWPLIRSNLTYTQNCNNVVCDGSKLDRSTGKTECQYYDDNGNKVGNPIKCPWKG